MLDARLLCPCAHPVGVHTAHGCSRAPVGCDCRRDPVAAAGAAIVQARDSSPRRCITLADDEPPARLAASNAG